MWDLKLMQMNFAYHKFTLLMCFMTQFPQINMDLSTLQNFHKENIRYRC